MSGLGFAIVITLEPNKAGFAELVARLRDPVNPADLGLVIGRLHATWCGDQALIQQWQDLMHQIICDGVARVLGSCASREQFRRTITVTDVPASAAAVPADAAYDGEFAGKEAVDPWPAT